MDIRPSSAQPTHGRPPCIAALLATLLAMTPATFAQEGPDPTHGETIEVELVNVEVRVLDREGRPVGNLTADDFEVLHDGVSVPVTNFTEFRDGLAVREGEPGATKADHHLIVYLDELHLLADHREALVEALKAFVTGGPIPAGNIMILRQGRELFIDAPFGSSERDLLGALSGIAEAPPGLGQEATTRQALDEIQRAWNQSRDATGSGEASRPQVPGDIFGESRAGGTSPRDVTGSSGSLGSGAVSRSCDIFKSRVEAVLDSWMRERGRSLSITLASLNDSATYLSGLQGNKSLLYLSDALETMPGRALASYADTICPGGERNLAMQALAEEIDSSLLRLARHAAANRIAFYPVQGRDFKVGGGDASDAGMRAGSLASFDVTRQMDEQSGLVRLAEETGGLAMLGQDDYLGAFEQLGGEMLSFYSLAYRPPASEEAMEHRIEIEMRDETLTARHRRGYRDKSSDERFTESLQGALHLGLVDNPLEARLAASEFRAAGEGGLILPLRVVLPVELVSFNLQGDRLLANVLVRVLSRSLESGQMGGVERSFQVEHREEDGGEWMQLPVDLVLVPGSHLIAVGVLDRESGMRSLVSTTIDVPSS